MTRTLFFLQSARGDFSGLPISFRIAGRTGPPLPVFCAEFWFLLYFFSADLLIVLSFLVLACTLADVSFFLEVTPSAAFPGPRLPNTTFFSSDPSSVEVTGPSGLHVFASLKDDQTLPADAFFTFLRNHALFRTCYCVLIFFLTCFF